MGERHLFCLFVLILLLAEETQSSQTVPTNVRLSGLESNKAALTWEPPKNSTESTAEYTIFYSNNGFTWSELNTTEQSVAIPYEGQSLYAAVAPILESGGETRQVNYSKIAKFDQTDLRPTIPENVRLTRLHGNKARLTWENPENSKENTRDYSVLHSINGVKWMELNTTEQSIVIPYEGPNLYAAVAIVPKLEAEIRQFRYSKIAKIEGTGPRSTLQTDVELTRLDGNKTVLTWEPPENSRGNTTEYPILYSTNGFKWIESNTSEQSTVYPYEGQNIYTTVATVSKSGSEMGQDNYSKVVNFHQTDLSSTLQTDVELTLLDGNKTVLTWEPPENSRGNTTEYPILYSANGFKWIESNTSEQSTVYPYEGQNIYTTVATVPESGSEMGQDNYSNVVKFHQTDLRPTIPTNVRLSPLECNKALLTWECPENSKENITGYTILYSFNGVEWMELNTTEESVIISYQGESLYAAVAIFPESGAGIRQFSYSKIAKFKETGLQRSKNTNEAEGSFINWGLVGGLFAFIAVLLLISGAIGAILGITHRR
ncbi:hypothetical protein Aperf_G00000050667 [Anoplocephala perfoliata]